MTNGDNRMVWTCYTTIMLTVAIPFLTCCPVFFEIHTVALNFYTSPQA